MSYTLAYSADYFLSMLLMLKTGLLESTSTKLLDQMIFPNNCLLRDFMSYLYKQQWPTSMPQSVKDKFHQVGKSAVA